MNHAPDEIHPFVVPRAAGLSERPQSIYERSGGLRFLTRSLALGIASLFLLPPSSFAQTDPQTPAPSPAAAASEESEKNLDAAKKELEGLETKAKAGDVAAALELANKLVEYRNVVAAIPYYRQAGEGGKVEAQEKLGVLLLKGGERSVWPEGHSWLDRAVQSGSVRAMEEQARILLRGSHGREQSIEGARELLEKARTLPGAVEAHFLLGKMAAEGIGRERDGAVAVEHLRRGVEAGSVDSMLGLFDLFITDTLVKKDLAEAERLALKAYDLGNAEAAYRLGVLFEKANAEKPDYKKARGWLEKARERGHPGASARLGIYALNGSGEEKNAGRAYVLYREAAERGHADASFAVAQLYDQGNGVPADLVAAAGWYRVAAEQGQPQAQNEFGARLASGRGIPSDPKLAVLWFQRAAEKGVPAAFVNLGELVLSGTGVEADPNKAYSLFETAAKEGHAGAQERLARMCEKGVGIGVPDPVGAAYWSARAAESDERLKDYAAERREALEEKQRGELDRRLAR